MPILILAYKQIPNPEAKDIHSLPEFGMIQTEVPGLFLYR
jgi:hypothetical protein